MSATKINSNRPLPPPKKYKFDEKKLRSDTEVSTELEYLRSKIDNMIEGQKGKRKLDGKHIKLPANPQKVHRIDSNFLHTHL